MIIDYASFNDYDIFDCDIQPPPKGNRGTREKIYYKDLICAFDIETSIIDGQNAVMYVWQFQIGDAYTVMGRTWDEFLLFAKNIAAEMPDRGTRVVAYVHNLAHEFQFLAGVYNFLPDEVFCLDTRKPVKCTMYDCLELRCSYIQTNMSLDVFTHKMGVKSPKLAGFDYSKVRYWYTELTDDEIAYCVNDVKGLVQAIETEMLQDGDDLYSIPLTSTGYVRRDFKRAMRKCRKWVLPMMPCFDVYTLLREAFRGGNTHANRYEAGFILKDVKSVDRSSSYPEVQCNSLFPMSKFVELHKRDNETVMRQMQVRGKALLMRVQLENITLKNELWGCPYLSRDKCREISNPIYDNGRILSADYLETTITDVDYNIIAAEYYFKMTVTECYMSRYAPLPTPMTDVIKHYYKLKTELKNVPGQEYFYMKSKNKLNSVYGCTAQDPVKDSILFTDGDYVEEGVDAYDLLEKSNKRGFIPYQWGVWCTAWARYELERGIRLAHSEKATFVYCDTDSVKYTGEIDWKEYNAEKTNYSTVNGAYAEDPDGITHYMGVYEYEGEYKEFKTLGAKKYAYVDSKDELHITVAGVPKIKGAAELKAAGGLKEFKEGFVFRAGKLMSVYNDDANGSYTTEDTVTIQITRNVALQPTEYHLGITAEYAEILQNSYIYKQGLRILEKSGIIKEHQ